MDKKKLYEMLIGIRKGEVNVDEAFEQIKDIPYADLQYAKIDYHRELRNGYPEVIYCPGKDIEHIKGIVTHMMTKDNNIIATRALEDTYTQIKLIVPEAVYFSAARIIFIQKQQVEKCLQKILVITAGTADIPVAEEAAVTSEILGNSVERLYDVGVAGIHRLLSKTHVIDSANVIIVVAGMEGALASVVGGLAGKPVVAVPTSVGYGANFGGLSALLCMLNSCAAGIGVVNIDNGFGAACLASMINKMNL